MTTFPGSDARSGDGAVHSLLWRLRARLVTPPAEERVRSDLDRVLAVARERAHHAPSAGATATPNVDTDVSQPDQPLVAGSSAPVRPLVAAGQDAPYVDELSHHRGRDLRGFAAALTRAAAAGFVILAVGTGASAATDGQLSLTALFARDAVPVPQTPLEPDGTAVAVAPDGDASVVAQGNGVDPDVQAAGADVDEADQRPSDSVEQGATEVDAVPNREADDGPPAAPSGQEPIARDADRSPADAGPADGSPGTGTASDESSAGSSSASGGGSPAPPPDDDSPPSPPGGDGDSSGTPDGSDPTPDPDEQVIAAPPSPGLDGFGEARCEGEELAECLTDGDGPAVGDDRAAVDSSDDLASRRSQPDPATSTEDTFTQ